MYLTTTESGRSVIDEKEPPGGTSTLAYRSDSEKNKGHVRIWEALHQALEASGTCIIPRGAQTLTKHNGRVGGM